MEAILDDYNYTTLTSDETTAPRSAARNNVLVTKLGSSKCFDQGRVSEYSQHSGTTRRRGSH